MPFGVKKNAFGVEVDFNEIYTELIAPAIEKADLEPIRADNEVVGGLIHKPMYERLVLCEYAVADLTTANANVFYELGLRHAARPRSTILLFSKDGTQLPFDVGPLRAIPYDLGPEGSPSNIESNRENLTKGLLEARAAVAEGTTVDSPVFQLVEGYPSEIEHTKTDIFRDQVEYSSEKKREFKTARGLGAGALHVCEEQLGALADVEAGVVIDLFLSYRAVKAWEAMIALVERMPGPLAATAMVREQLALALNRAGQGEEAEDVLLELLERRGPSSETYGILGRVYKDRWEAALKKGESFLADGFLDRAIEAYQKGFEADWRDAYPGVNAVTLMELKDPPDPQREKLIPIVTYAAERRIASGKPDYWDHATLLELAVLGKDRQKARTAITAALPLVREPWEPETTVRNLRLIREARDRRQENVSWAKEVEEILEQRSAQ